MLEIRGKGFLLYPLVYGHLVNYPLDTSIFYPLVYGHNFSLNPVAGDAAGQDQDSTDGPSQSVP